MDHVLRTKQHYEVRQGGVAGGGNEHSHRFELDVVMRHELARHQWRNSAILLHADLHATLDVIGMELCMDAVHAWVLRW